MLYTKLPTSAIDFDDSVNGGVYGKYRPVSAYFWQCCIGHSAAAGSICMHATRAVVNVTMTDLSAASFIDSNVVIV